MADQAYFEKEVQPYLDNEQIIYEGHVTPEFKKELLSNAYALLHMINYEEAFGIGVVEAMASGTPVIAMNRVQCLSLSGMERLDFLLIVLRKLPKLCKNLAPYPAKKCRENVEKRFRLTGWWMITLKCMRPSSKNVNVRKKKALGLL
nr:glycosyltransferase [Methanosarcina barkeri]